MPPALLLLVACGPSTGDRAALHAAERRVLAAEAETALAEGRVDDAARIIAVERPFYPDAFDGLTGRVRDATTDPAVLVRLGDVVDPAALDRVRLARACGPDLPATLAAVDGVRREHGRIVLDGVRRELVTAPDEALLADAARDRLARLVATPEARAAFGISGAFRPSGELWADVDAAIALGVPESLAVAEAVDAALAALDPHTRAVWPASLPSWQEHHAGVGVGIGVDLLDADGGVVVRLPAPGGPAWGAGVHAGDALVAVDGAPVATSEAAQRALGGAPGSEVRLSLLREGRASSVAVLRAEVPEETVTGFRRTEHGWDTAVAADVALVRISAFRPRTDDELDAVLPADARRVVLDLRGNGGGDVQAALDTADRFVVDGDLVRLEGRAVPPPQPGPNGEVAWNQAVPGHAWESAAVVVLVDGRTASAAEILAAALRDRAGATVVGEPTFGKLSSQGLRSDPSGVAWQVTTGRWTPVSGPIERVLPTVAVPISPAERQQADERLRRREWPAVHPDGSAVPYLGLRARADLPQLDRDVQLDAAVAAARASTR